MKKYLKKEINPSVYSSPQQDDESTDVRKSINSEIIEKELAKADKKIDKMVDGFFDRLILDREVEYEKSRRKAGKSIVETFKFSTKMHSVDGELREKGRERLNTMLKSRNYAIQNEMATKDRLTVISERKSKFAKELKEDIKRELRDELSRSDFTKPKIRYEGRDFIEKVKAFFYNFLDRLDGILHNPVARSSTEILSRKSGNELEKRIHNKLGNDIFNATIELQQNHSEKPRRLRAAQSYSDVREAKSRISSAENIMVPEAKEVQHRKHAQQNSSLSRRHSTGSLRRPN